MPITGDTPFYGFAFPAATGLTNRTMPARLSETINVKDWGAAGSGSGNDAPAIQAAINYAITHGGGKVFFPTGQYPCSSPLTVGSENSDVRVELIGSGKWISWISYHGADWVISKGAGNTYDNIGKIAGFSVYNSSSASGAGCIKITGEGVSISDIDIPGGKVGIDASAANGALIRDVQLTLLDITATSNSPTPYATSSVGIYLGNGCTAMNCRCAQGGFIAFALSGRGASCLACSGENMTVAARLGWSPSGETPAIGCMLQGFQTEKCIQAVELYNCQGCYLSGNFISAGASLPVAQAITGTSWAANVATATVSTPHYLPVGPSPVVLNLAAPWHPGTRWVYVTPVAPVTGSTSFTYSLPGSNPGASITGSWQLPTKYGIRCRIVSETFICGPNAGANSALAAIDLDYDGESQFRNNVYMGDGGANGGWKMPTTALHMAGWKFIECGAATMQDNSVCQNPNPYFLMNYADLPGVFTPPGSGIYPAGPFDGQEFDIADGNNAAFDGNQTGGGSGKYKVRWNSAAAAWKRIG